MDLSKVDSFLPKSDYKLELSGDHGISGLNNLGNTCYINSSIQCLSFTLPLTNYLLKELLTKVELKNTGNDGDDAIVVAKLTKILKKHLDKSKDNKLPESSYLLIYYIKLLSELWKDNCAITLAPKAFVKIFNHLFPEGGIFRQNDSQESIIFMLDTFHELLANPVVYKITGEVKNEFDRMMLKSINEWGQHYKNTHSRILDIFSGQEHERLQCTHCEEVTHKFPPFMYIMLPVNNKTNTLYDCFDKHCRVEQLDKDNQWICDKCNKATQAYRKTAFWKLPEILIISFKRFEIKERYGHQYSIKNKDMVEYPINNLDLNDYVTNPEGSKRYNLYAINCHIGGTNGGHYYSYCRKHNDKWYEFNDDDILEITDLNYLVTNDAYMLFYQKIHD